MQVNQKGFSVVEILIIVVIVGLFGAVGWLVYDRQKSKTSETSNTQSSTQQKEEASKQETKIADPYEGWETYTLKYEGFSFRYPKSYEIVDESSTTDPDVTPGYDRLELTKDNGFVISIQTGLNGIGGACQTCKLALSKEIALFGEPAYLNFRAEENSKVSLIIVASDKTNLFGAGIQGKNVRLTRERGGTALPLSISMHYVNNGVLVEKSLQEISNSEDVAEAIKILDSASY